LAPDRDHSIDMHLKQPAEQSVASGAADDPKTGRIESPTNTDLAHMAEALAQVPPKDRPAVVSHIRALADLSPATRATILTLTDHGWQQRPPGANRNAAPGGGVGPEMRSPGGCPYILF